MASDPNAKTKIKIPIAFNERMQPPWNDSSVPYRGTELV
jgi:hypothetical protein